MPDAKCSPSHARANGRASDCIFVHLRAQYRPHNASQLAFSVNELVSLTFSSSIAERDRSKDS